MKLALISLKARYKELINLQFRVSRPVQQKQEFVVVALRKQIVCKQNHQGLIRSDLGRVCLQQLETLVNKVLLDFLCTKKEKSLNWDLIIAFN